MAGQQITVMHGGQEKKAVLVSIKDQKEFVSTYTLEDGSILSVRFPLTEVARLMDEHDGAGEPIYQIKGQLVASVNGGPGLRQKKA